jgi:hypothetical protein
MIDDARTIAKALGDTSTLIYPIPRFEPDMLAKAG